MPNLAIALMLFSLLQPSENISKNLNQEIYKSSFFKNPIENSILSPKSSLVAKAAFTKPDLTTANLKFSFNLFKQLVQVNTSKNIFISPYSVAIALTMTYNGAKGETQQEMARTLQLFDLEASKVNESTRALRETLLGKSGDKTSVQIEIANSLWVTSDLALNPDFAQTVKQFYQAEIASLNFANPASLSTINNWVKQNTRGKIDRILDRINQTDILFLINAVYFKGDWERPFIPSKTKPKPFYLANGKQKNVPMMRQTGQFRYFETDKFQAIGLRYKHSRIGMYIFLPKSNSSLEEFYQSLNLSNWQEWRSHLQSESVDLELPRFKLEYAQELSKTLEALGMKIAFSPRADFSAIAKGGGFISEVKHKAFIDVNEKGTEAAAVTSVGMSRGGEIHMAINRPFFLTICDRDTDTILFMGSVVDP
ncbi:serpin family protein [Tumidithrix elongata RA019]|uniref:Serpin family protein n=1 Tax=Tumidithrix elongata BACA0141 TaxID=2716417 RepID=A0AAW9PSG3_9CYAN|nr:serpin family protein [Tumidithrix elongata RA019]